MAAKHKKSPIGLSGFIYQHFSHLWLTRKQRDNISLIVCAMLMGCFSGLIAPLEQQSLGIYAIDKFRYLISRSKTPFTLLIRAYESRIIRLMIRLAGESNLRISLIIDDTFCKKDKRSKYIPIGGKKLSITGFSLVTAILMVGDVCIPLVPRLAFRKDAAKSFDLKYRSKVDQAIYMIDHWRQLGLPPNQTRLIIDIWYLSKTLIARARQAGFTVIGAVKSNRRFTITPIGSNKANETHVDKIRHACHKYQAKRILKDNFTYQLFTRTGTLRDINETGTLLFSKRTRLSDNNITWRYIFVLGEKLKADEILEIYGQRWNIETFHQLWKYYFVPKNFRLHSRNSRQSYVKTMRMIFCTILSMYFCCHVLLLQMDGTQLKYKYNDDRGFMAIAMDNIRTELTLRRGSIKTLFET